MDRKTMLANLNGDGDDVGSDLDDGLEGWFGWRVRGDVLRVTFEDSNHRKHEAQWILLPVSHP